MSSPRPERKRIGLHLVKRITVLALLATLSVLVIPRLLASLGLWGPSLPDRLAEAERAVQAARWYGAPDAMVEQQAALRELDQARSLARSGKGRLARLAAGRAVEHAIRAQRDALVRRELERRRAAAIVGELDRSVEDLEKLYSERTRGLDRRTVSRLFSQMKQARQVAATLALAYQKGGYEEVIAGQAAAKKVLAATAEQLQRAAEPQPGPSTSS
jgi:hypothetical protein